MARTELTEEFVDRRTVDGRLIERVQRPRLARELNLEPHPEGGWYRRTWVSPEQLTLTDSDASVRRRPAATLIVFLLPAGESSAWHRVASTEIWIGNGPGTIALQYGGCGDVPVDGEIVLLGDVAAGHEAQAIVEPHVWQRTLRATHDAFASCMVSPGFDFDDFTMDDNHTAAADHVAPAIG